MVADSQIYDWFTELGMKVEKIASGNFYFHITIAPPIGEGVKVSIIRTNPNSTYYIVTTVVDLDLNKIKKEPSLLRNIKRELMRMNVEFFLLPPDAEVPKSIQIAKIVFIDGLTKNEMLNVVELVKNSAYLTLSWLEGP
ncbi:DUF2299 domain-containing protein [Stygiolobus caldivivus]|uniref:DUF2299 domain-containing protein n=1 Tax=Stygiolobus caldivivus TaxID=2824673 RepID=A0A8D5U833_9CREN|nr:DUF2299 domain-containing protein [Stygiolobus caldivivus]BCU70917.1 hypothetical protein KN1_22140 [Stygiolobus caldivivus]